MRHSQRRIPGSLILAIGVVIGWGLDRLPTPRPIVWASGGDRWGDSSVTTGPVLIRYDERLKVQIPLDVVYYLYHKDKSARLLATSLVPAGLRAGEVTRHVRRVRPRHGLQDRRGQRPETPFPHDHGWLGAYSDGWSRSRSSKLHRTRSPCTRSSSRSSAPSPSLSSSWSSCARSVPGGPVSSESELNTSDRPLSSNGYGWRIRLGPRFSESTPWQRHPSCPVSGWSGAMTGSCGWWFEEGSVPLVNRKTTDRPKWPRSTPLWISLQPGIRVAMLGNTALINDDFNGVTDATVMKTTNPMTKVAGYTPVITGANSSVGIAQSGMDGGEAVTSDALLLRDLDGKNGLGLTVGDGSGSTAIAKSLGQNVKEGILTIEQDMYFFGDTTSRTERTISAAVEQSWPCPAGSMMRTVRRIRSFKST